MEHGYSRHFIDPTCSFFVTRSPCARMLVGMSTIGKNEAPGHKHRIETDLLGDREVPADAYYGVHTMRAIENFSISGTRGEVTMTWSG